MSDARHTPGTPPSDTSDTVVPLVRQPAPRPARSAQEVLQLLYSAVVGVAGDALDQQETRFIKSRSVHPDRGTVGTLMLSFADGEVWYVECERERS